MTGSNVKGRWHEAMEDSDQRVPESTRRSNVEDHPTLRPPSISASIQKFRGRSAPEVEGEGEDNIANDAETPALAALWLTISLLPALGALAFGVITGFYLLRDRDASLMAQSNSGEISREECEAQLSRSY